MTPPRRVSLGPYGRPRWILTIVCAIFTWLPIAASATLSLAELPSKPLGQHARHYAESSKLTLEEARALVAQEKFEPSRSDVLTFGIGADPRWVHLAVHNPYPGPRDFDLVIEISWLDHVAIHFVGPGGEQIRHELGDSQPFAKREIPSRGFVVNHTFVPGKTEIYIRVETPDPMVIPIELAEPETRDTDETLNNYSYGVVYGYLLGLLAYNTTLFFGLRQARFFLYSVYLTAFILMNCAYTGHGFAWLWSESVTWQRWGIAIHIVMYSITGLIFATSFLETRHRFPRAHRFVWALIAIFAGATALSLILQSQSGIVAVSFVSTCIFAVVMFALGVMGTAAGQVAARYFLLAAITAIIGTVLSTLSTWGLIPFHDWTFRAVEFGLLTDATLLALALAYQLRTSQRARRRADELARRDPLTDLHNRRGFFEITGPIWDDAVNGGHPASVVLLDLDHFKRLNDKHGHAVGDDALVTVAKTIQATCRPNDIVVRWGGEEFAVFLPDAGLDAAVELAESMRMAVGELRISTDDGEVSLSVSCGVAARAHHRNFDALMVEADQQMYSAKRAGRNKVAHDGTYRGSVRVRSIGNSEPAPSTG